MAKERGIGGKEEVYHFFLFCSVLVGVVWEERGAGCDVTASFCIILTVVYLRVPADYGRRCAVTVSYLFPYTFGLRGLTGAEVGPEGV